MAAPGPQEAKPRALALDALRGLAIFGMCLSGVVPWKGLPNWMYHAQFPRPEAVYDRNWAGFTWVDLVFPAFLFSMGVAFPFAMSARLRKGATSLSLVPGIVLRGLALVAFAIYVQHIAPYQISASPTTSTWLQALLGFALLFPIYTRLPEAWNPKVKWGIRVAGIAGALGLLVVIWQPWLAEWKLKAPGITSGQIALKLLGKSDIIILVLANMAVFGSLAWLLTRGSVTFRMMCLLIGFASHFARYPEFSWLKPITKSPAPWLYNFEFLKYLLIVIPGTMIGDALLTWMRSPATGAKGDGLSRGTLAWLAAVLLAMVVGVHVGLQARLPGMTALGTICIAAMLAPIFLQRGGQAEGLLRTLFLWGSGWLALGLLLDAGALDWLTRGLSFTLSEGGIKKDQSTLSYYFVTTGLSIYLLISLTIWIDLLKHRRWFAILIANGQNPMIAYVGIRNLLAPVVSLTGLDAWMFGKVFATPWTKAIWSFVKTVLLSVVVAGCTRLKIIWRT